MSLARRYDNTPLLTTEPVILEIGNGLARSNKPQAVQIITNFLRDPQVEVVRLTPELFDAGFALYQSHTDKQWGLVDCISFVVMRQRNVYEALTFDGHFAQAGFRALLRDDNGAGA